LNENGETIIDEEEYELIAKLQELKGTYRNDYDQWKSLKSEINYCQNLVNQCQNRLLQGKKKIISFLLNFSLSLSLSRI
jgi:kinesin family protein 6/9